MSVGWISTYNTRCGAATYSEHLVKHLKNKPTILAAHSSTHDFPDDEYTVRCWTSWFDNFENVRSEIINRNLKSIVIVYHPGLTQVQTLYDFINWCADNSRPVILIITSMDSLSKVPANINRCFAVAVQTEMHLEILKQAGFEENTFILPHGILVEEYEKKPKSNNSFLIGNFGFFLPNKGIMELIQAFHILRYNDYDYKLRLVNAEYPAGGSADLIAAAKKYVSDNSLNEHVEFYNDFLPDSESLKLLSECDLYVHPYRPTMEPVSGSVRYGLSSGLPVAVTPNPVFGDLKDITFTMSGFTPEEMAESIVHIKNNIDNNTQEYQDTMAKATAWVEKYNYKTIAEKFEKIIEESLGV